MLFILIKNTNRNDIVWLQKDSKIHLTKKKKKVLKMASKNININK